MLRIFSLTLVLLAVGCAGYRLGPTNGETAGVRSVQVNFFGNQTLEPRLTAPLNNALRKAIQQDGTYRLDTRGGGDLVVDGTITRFDRSGISFQPTDVITVRDYALSLTTRVTVRERSTGKVLVEREVIGRTTIRVGADQASTERQAVPLLAEDVARKAAALIVDGEW
jgi:hypothetical protein